MDHSKLTFFQSIIHRVFVHYRTTILSALAPTCAALYPLVTANNLPKETMIASAVIFFVGALCKDPKFLSGALSDEDCEAGPSRE